MATCLDYGIDFPHTAVHCPACWDRVTEQNKLKALNRANELKEKELKLREEGVWVDTPEPTAKRVAYPLKKEPPVTGGMNVNPTKE